MSILDHDALEPIAMMPDAERIRAFAEALKQLPGGRMVRMGSVDKPECGTVGCHAGEAMMALDLLRVPASENDWYAYDDQADRLARYLFNDEKATYGTLLNWATVNRDVWGNPWGGGMFHSNLAFDQYGSNDDGTPVSFPAQVIRDWWQGVSERYDGVLA